MKEFGEAFRKYNPLGIKEIAIPIPAPGDTKSLRLLEPLKISPAEKMPKIRLGAPRIGMEKARPFRVLGVNEIPDRLKEELDKVIIGVVPTANVHKISPNQRGLAEVLKKTLSKFNYYVVELGLNVMLGKKFKIPDLRFEVELRCNTSDRKDVTAYDIAPDDTLEHIEAVSGKISLGITKLLKFIPSPTAQTIADLLDIEIKLLELKWGFDKYKIDATGRKNYKVCWRVYETNVVQGFNPMMILKARKNVKKISASAKVIYELQTRGWKTTTKVDSDETEIAIWPM